MGLRFTRVRGLEKNRANATMIFACHNLKKMALWRNKNNPNMAKCTQILSDFVKILLKSAKKLKKEKQIFFKYLLCQQSEIVFTILILFFLYNYLLVLPRLYFLHIFYSLVLVYLIP